MNALKSAVAVAGAIAASTVTGTALANHDGWPPPISTSPRYVVVPQQPAIVGHVTAVPVYSYEPAPRYYYYQPEPTYYYYEPATVVSYYYNHDSSAFPRSNSRD